MSTVEKYTNPFTDFGFETAEIAKFMPDEKEKYEASLKYYRDLKNVVDSSYEEGRLEGKQEGKLEGRLEGKQEIARQMKSEGESLEKIMRYTGLLAGEIKNI